MYTNITNKIGLEAEFLITDKDNNLLYPGDYGFDTDEFIILGEFRCEPAETRAKVIANFYEGYYKIVELAKKRKVNIDISTGYSKITPKFYSEIMKKMGSKEISKCSNIYDTDILELSDAEVQDGKILFQKISTGLHIHFSSQSHAEDIFQERIKQYEPANIPLSIEGIHTELNLFKLVSETTKERKLSTSANRITKPVLYNFVESLDKYLLHKYNVDIPLKFRNPGFYELKSHGGFEYRSLPFNQKLLDNIYDVVNFSFSLLEGLDL